MLEAGKRDSRAPIAISYPAQDAGFRKSIFEGKMPEIDSLGDLQSTILNWGKRIDYVSAQRAFAGYYPLRFERSASGDLSRIHVCRSSAHSGRGRTNGQLIATSTANAV